MKISKWKNQSRKTLLTRPTAISDS